MLPNASTPRTHNDYPIGLICALAIEKAAVEALLDQKHPRLKNLSSDENDYTHGSIGRHNVVVACLPAGMMGTNSAATVARDMQRSYPIKFGLMVGVGGGIWSKKNDIRLGDVVVSQPEGRHGGVVQWDFGKMETGGFRRTGSLNKPPRILLNALQHIKTLHITKGNRLHMHLLEMVAKNPAMADTMKHQGAEHDRLFQPSYHHNIGEECEDCDVSMEVDRTPGRTSSAPKIHYGNIASGNEVVKDGNTRDRIASAEGVICFEMEAAGLMDTFPCIVIRGICDYADSHKNKRWQAYAAATAAAFAKELLDVIDEQEVDVLKPTKLHYMLPFPSSEKFCGREEYMKRLEEIMLVTDRHNRGALVGLGGIGKTRIALEFAPECKKNRPQSIFWVHAGTAARLEKAYLDIARTIGIAGYESDDRKIDRFRLVRNWFESEVSGRWLMIIDNADDDELLYGRNDQQDDRYPCRLVDYFPRSPNGSILLTTRNEKIAHKFTTQLNVLDTTALTPAESENLLVARLGHDGSNANDRGDLAKVLQRVPLALVQATAFIKEQHYSVSEYVKLYNESDLTKTNEDRLRM